MTIYKCPYCEWVMREPNIAEWPSTWEGVAAYNVALAAFQWEQEHHSCCGMTQEEFAAKWAEKEQALTDYLLQLEYPNQDANDAAAVLAARLRYIDAGHDAMDAGLRLLKEYGTSR